MITLANGKKVLPAHIVNEFDCGCVIVSEFTAGAGCKIVEYCPIHAAAPDLLAACEDALKKLNWPIYTEKEKLTMRPCREKLEVAIAKAKP